MSTVLLKENSAYNMQGKGQEKYGPRGDNVRKKC